MKSLSFVVFRAGVGLLSLSMSAYGGFSIPRQGIVAVPLGGENADKDFLDGADALGIPYPPINVPIPPADLVALKAHSSFAGKTDAAIQTKLVNMRRAVLCAIELINKEDARIGEGMLRMFRAGKLCIGLAPDSYGVGAEILNDGKVEFNMEPVNFYLLPCDRLKAWSPQLFELANTIGHEGLHGVQEVSPWRNGQTMAQAKNIQCRELEASEGEFARAMEMLRVLDAIENTGQLPADARGMFASMGSALIADFRFNPAGLAARIAEFRGLAQRIKLRSGEVAEFRRLFKRAAALAIAGSPDTATVLAGLRRHRLFQYYGTTREFAPITRYYISNAPQLNETPGQPPKIEGGGGMRQIVQPDATPRDFTCPFVDSICDAAVVENANGDATGIFLGGVNDTTAKGVIVHAGIGADGYIIPASATKVFESSALSPGFNLELNPFDHKLYTINLLNGGITRLDDTNSDGVFDVGVPSGGFAGLPADLVSLGLETAFSSRDRLTARLGSAGDLRLADEPVFQTDRSGPAANFLPLPEHPFFRDFTTPPAIESVLHPGSGFLALSGTPGATFSVRTGGPSPATLATGMLSPLGRELLTVPVSGNDPLFLIMTEGGLTLPIPVVPAPLFPTLQIDGSGGADTINLSAHAPAGSVAQLFRTDLRVPQVRTALGPPGFCNLNEQLSLTVPAASLPPGSGFFTAEVKSPVLPALPGSNDSFSATPGLSNVFDVSLNDRPLPPGAKFELGSPPDLPASLFHFHGDGTFEVIPRNASDQLNFTYRINLYGALSPFYNVVVLRDITSLTNPPVIPSALGPLVVAWMLDENVQQDFPLYQFIFAFNIFDNCGLAHWHAHEPVFSLQDPVGVVDPDSSGCGFGPFPDLEPYSIYLPLDVWNAFRAAHP